MKYAFNGIEPPVGKYIDILEALLEPSDKVKQIDLCCGLGFGKTYLAIQAAALTMDEDPQARGLFLEPDWDRVNSVFLENWYSMIPEELYTEHKKWGMIEWHNGAKLLYRPRVVTGSKKLNRSKKRGPEFSFIIDDEAAIGFDHQQFVNTFARIRRKAKNRFYFTSSTPLPGPYGRFINRGTNTLFRGRTSDNVYLLAHEPEYESRLRGEMSPEEARRELDGELIALEGRCWDTWSDEEWPKGNRHWHSWDPNLPWVLSCDLGGHISAWHIWQSVPAIDRFGNRVFSGNVDVIVGEYLPSKRSGADSVLSDIETDYGWWDENRKKYLCKPPSLVCVGRDVNSPGAMSGDVPKVAFRQKWAGVQVKVPDGYRRLKEPQGQALKRLILNNRGERRICVAKKLREHGNDKGRGVLQVMLEDVWPDAGYPHVFHKDKAEAGLEDARDSILHYVAGVHSDMFSFAGRTVFEGRAETG